MATAKKYVLAIICPPLAVLVFGDNSQALVNLVLTCCFWIPGMIHALVVVHRHRVDHWTDRELGREMKQYRLNSVLRRVR